MSPWSPNSLRIVFPNFTFGDVNLVFFGRRSGLITLVLGNSQLGLCKSMCTGCYRATRNQEERQEDIIGSHSLRSNKHPLPHLQLTLSQNRAVVRTPTQKEPTVS